MEKGGGSMLKEKVRAYCEAGENCSRIILQSAAEEYGISLPEEVLAVCGGINGGFGIGWFVVAPNQQ